MRILTQRFCLIRSQLEARLPEWAYKSIGGYDQSALIDGLSVSSRNAAEPIPIGARKFQGFRLFGYVSHQDLTQSPSNGKESAMPSEEP